MTETNKIRLGAFVVVVVLALLWIAYQSAVVVPRERIEYEQARIADNEIKYELCVDDAYSMYSGDWDSACSVLGREKDCILPVSYSKRLNEKRATDEKNCITMYK